MPSRLDTNALIALLLLISPITSHAQKVTPEVPPPVIPIGYDAYRMWDHWPYQRIGARAYMRSTYDRHGANHSVDASHYLYQTAEDFNVTLDIQGQGVLYFARYNHWHGSPWHYEVDSQDHIVQETTTADPSTKLTDSTFIPESAFPKPLAWTYATTKGADLSWIPIGFTDRFRMAYARTYYGTGYYIYHHYLPGAPLTQNINAWNPSHQPPADVLNLLNNAGADIASLPTLNTATEISDTATLNTNQTLTLANLTGPSTLRALKLSIPRDRATDFGDCQIRVTWDNRAHPSIEAPIALFFGAGTLYNRDDKTHLVKSLPMNIRFDKKRVHLACYFPMPFFQSARIEIINTTQQTFNDIRYTLRTQPIKTPANHLSYFHATFVDHPNPTLGQDLIFLDTTTTEGGGDWTGSFVGTSFIFSDNAVLHTLEGDPRFFFDDSQSPQAYGTGTEEWGGGGDYWGGATMTLPFAGHPVGVARGQEPKNKRDLIHSAYRFLLGDLMPFGKNARIQFEHGSVNQSTEHYQSVTYWYGLPGASLTLTDELDIGDTQSETSHAYHSPNASAPYKITSRYEWGPDTVSIADRIAPLPNPQHFVEYEFEALANTRYTIWVRGTTAKTFANDSTWIQFDDYINTPNLAHSYSHSLGLGNWRDTAPPNQFSWSSTRPNQPPHFVIFVKPGKHRARVQLKKAPHVLDQIWLSTTQHTQPDFATPAKSDNLNQIILDATNTTQIAGDFTIINHPDASTGKLIQIRGKNPSDSIEAYPTQTQIGRTTKTTSQFTLKINPKNLGVLLRRTLDYQFPNQRANVLIADGSIDQPTDADFKPAGVWYLAGSNTCYSSYPRQAGELGASQPVVQTSNRRFRDDEFLLPLNLTKDRASIHIRVEFSPTNIPLLPGRELAEQAWSEIRYKAYSYTMPPMPPLYSPY